MRLGFSGFIYLVILLSSIRFRIAVGVSKTSSEAYVSLLYGDEFLLGVRVLGKSIRDTGTTKDMVVLVSDGVSDYTKKLLQADGWIVQTISLLANPNQVRPKRFWGVYTKLKIFNLTDYKKVVYLDADTVVLKSIEDLFECRKFCANLKHSERLNSGVMVVEPSETVFNDMMNKVNTLYSYTGGDQGFLNSYFAGFANAHIFDPKLSSDVMNSRPVEMERLSTLYNADVGLYMLANKWMVDEKELRVVHYTLGPLKPWDWWTAWLLNPVDLWQNVRIQLEESLPGTGGGRNPRDIILVKFLFLLPIFVLLLISNRCFLLRRKDFFGVFCRGFLFGQIIKLYYKHRGGAGLSYSYSTVGVSSSSVTDSNQMFSIGIQSKVPTYLVGVSVFTCFISAVVSLALAFAAVPRQVMPWTGLLLLYEWTFTIFFILFGSYLRLIHQWGKMMAAQAGYYPAHRDSSDYDDRKGHQRQASSVDVATLYYGFGMALLAVAAPSLPCILGITALFPRLGLMVVGGIVLASFMTYASERLAIRAFLRGLEDRRDMPRTRNSCIC